MTPVKRHWSGTDPHGAACGLRWVVITSDRAAVTCQRCRLTWRYRRAGRVT